MSNKRVAFICIVSFWTVMLGNQAVHADGYFEKLKRDSDTACTEVKSALKSFSSKLKLSEGPGSVELQTHLGINKRNGCKVSLSGPYVSDVQPETDLSQHFVAEKWTALLIYDADGPTGGQYSFFKNDALCIVRYDTDGGGLGGPEPTKYDLEVTCVGGYLVTIVE